MNQLISIPEAAQLLGITRHTINCWVSQPRITFVKVGRRKVFDLFDLQRFIESNKVAARQGQKAQEIRTEQ
jgi:excisionase family DNA binding protein